MLRELGTSVSCCAACRAINLASDGRSSSYLFFQTPGTTSDFTSFGQTFLTGGECVTLSSFTFGLRSERGTARIQLNALLYTYNFATDQVTGSRLASQLTSAIQSQTSLTVTFPQPVQLTPATSYAIILTTAGLGQAGTNREIGIYLGDPNGIPGGTWLSQRSGDNPAEIETTPFTPNSQSFDITIN